MKTTNIAYARNCVVIEGQGTSRETRSSIPVSTTTSARTRMASHREKNRRAIS
ncbi:MAG: hypothetical protein JRI25_15415 [Deltaproteobacteria bacterium]|nr:hypothetical protein [Deltaproteobacteria bacterium]